MTEKELKIRTRKFAVEVLNFIDLLPNRKAQTSFQINSDVLQVPLPRTIGQHAGPEVIMNSLLK